MAGWRRLISRALRRQPQLEMLWPESRLESRLRWEVPAGFELRIFRPADEPSMIRLMHRAGFRGWGPAELKLWLPRALAGGYFVIIDASNGRLAATTMAADHPSPSHPGGGELCWLAVDPDYRGKGLGVAGCAATTNLLLEAGYRRIYLTTDDHRLPAVGLYLRLGYVPFLFEEDMRDRWQDVRRRLGQNV